MRKPARSLQAYLGNLFIVLLAGAVFSSGALAQAKTVKLEWITWSFFRFTSPNGKVIITNPFITGNPDAAAGIKLEEVGKPDLILVTDAHRDEVGDAVAIAKTSGARIVTPAFEFGTVLIGQGVPEAQVIRRNPGGRFAWEGITIRVVGSVHGSGGTDPASEFPVYGGVAAGFVVTFENGYTVYFMGSSAATQDMALWGETYKPDAMIFLMHPNSEPLDTGMAVKLVANKSPNLKMLLPHHHRVTPPPGALTVAEMRKVLDAMRVSIPITALAPKQSIALSK
ncbi:MAG: MBL fold metallo-hydrolase [Betaproteobacteria bacterium]|nr:MBL fold metallo-hydrolase [Betaproteobacteria bacterium]